MTKTEEDVKRLEEMYDIGELHGQQKLMGVMQYLINDNSEKELNVSEIKMLIYNTWKEVVIERNTVTKESQIVK